MTKRVAFPAAVGPDEPDPFQIAGRRLLDGCCAVFGSCIPYRIDFDMMREDDGQIDRVSRYDVQDISWQIRCVET